MKGKIAVVGCGNWGKNLLRNFCQLLGPEKVVCCDKRHELLQNAVEEYQGISTVADVELVWGDPNVTAVVIATPAPTHASLVIAALEAGKDVLVEKPMSLAVADGEAVVEAARRNRRVLMVGHVLEYHPAVRQLYQLVGEGAFGRLQYLYSNRLSLGRIRTEENALWSFAPHDIAIMLRLLGSMPGEVACHGGAYLNQEVADFTLTSLRFPNSVAAHIFVSWLHPFRDHRFVVVGERQMAVFDDSLPWDQKLVLYPHSVDWVNGQIPVARKADAEPVPIAEVEPLRVECEDFVKSVETRQPPLTDGESGLRVLRVLEAAQRSLTRGGRPESLESGQHPPKGYYAHPTATIDPGATIGDGTRIWHYSHVMGGARLGDDCVLGQNVFIGSNVHIGNGVKIQNNVSVYEGVELEDYVFCGPSMVFTNVFNPRSEIEQKDEFRRTLVKAGASLGAGCTIVCGVTIGRYAFVGAGAAVTRDVRDYALVYGNPARIQGWMCRCGERLSLGLDGTTEQTTCGSCGSDYSKTDQVVTAAAGEPA